MFKLKLPKKLVPVSSLGPLTQIHFVPGKENVMSVQKLAPALIGVSTERLREIFASVTRTCVQKVLMVSLARVTANVIVILENVDVKKVRINSYNPYFYIIFITGWDDDDCSCSTDKSACRGENGQDCNGHGSCVCGECKCVSKGLTKKKTL